MIAINSDSSRKPLAVAKSILITEKIPGSTFRWLWVANMDDIRLQQSRRLHSKGNKSRFSLRNKGMSEGDRNLSEWNGMFPIFSASANKFNSIFCLRNHGLILSFRSSSGLRFCCSLSQVLVLHACVRMTLSVGGE